MEFTLPLPQQLDNNGILLKQWNNFSHRFRCHQNSALLNGCTDETQSLLLFAASNHLKRVSDSLKMYGVDFMKMSKVLEMIEQICLPSFLLLFERFRYFTLEQESNETLHDFINIMRKQLDLCEFGDTKDTIMANSLVNGVNEDMFRQTLQTTTDRLCFDEAVSVGSNNQKKSTNFNNTTAAVPTSNNSSLSPTNDIDELPNNSSGEDSDEVIPEPKTRGDLKRKFKLSSIAAHTENMFIEPVKDGLKEEVDIEDSIFNSVVTTVRRKHKVKSKRRSSRRKHSSGRPKEFLCFKCDNEYASRKSFRRHVASKHGECSDYYCKHCRKTFHNRTECISHCMGHKTSPSERISSAEYKAVENTEFICWFCDEKLPNLDEYKKHALTHSAVRVFYCNLCQRKNHTLIRMIGHLKGHLSPRHRCEICANCFGRAELLEAHMQTHAAQPVHQCQICAKNFVSADRLQGHMKTHSGEKRFTCELCGKSFCQKMSLDYHKRVHSGEKPYECDICGKKTASFGYLRKHKQMHSDKRPYVCEVCGKSFRFISNLTRHRNGHTGKRAFACDVCGRTFIYREGLRDHIKAGRCPGRKQDGLMRRASRAPRSRGQHAPNTSVGPGHGLPSYGAPHGAETLLNELPHWQYMLRNSEPDGTEGLIVVPPYY